MRSVKIKTNVKLSLFNRSGSVFDGKKLIRDLAKICRKLDVGPPLVLNLIFLDNRSIRRMKLKYHNKKRSTDVLTFSYYSTSRRSRSRSLLEGDVFISPEKIRAQAREYFNSFYRELLIVAVHGILHVIGHRDYTAAEKASMYRKQDELLIER